MDNKRETLKEFYFSIKNCRECDLCKTRTKFVFGGGSAYAEVMFVGEAPGKNEDLQGLPFVGQAGKILDSLLNSIGMSRDDVFIANVLKCRPPENRDPRVDEIDTCKEYLFRQIEIINPKIICTLGKYSTQLLLNTSQGITSLRGKMYQADGRIIFPINHPAAALYTPSRMEILKADFQGIKRIMDSEKGGDMPVLVDSGSIGEMQKIREGQEMQMQTGQQIQKSQGEQIKEDHKKGKEEQLELF